MIFKLKILFCAILFFTSCKMEKESTVYIKNENSYPIEVSIRTNNISKTFSVVKATSEIEEKYTWTGLNNHDGSFIFFIKNINTGLKDSFAHGYFTSGELSNQIDLFSKGSELKVQILE